MAKTVPERASISWKSIIPSREEILESDPVYQLNFFTKKSQKNDSTMITTCDNQNIVLHSDESVIIRENTVFCKVEEFTYENIRDAVSKSVKKLKKNKISKLEVCECSNFPFDYKNAAADGLILSQFNYDFLKKKKDSEKYIFLTNHDYFRSHSQNIARFLTVTPPNIMTPIKFTEYVKEIIKFFKVPIFYENLSEKHCKDLKMNLFLSVGQGSTEESKFLILSYHGRKDVIKKESVSDDDKKRVKKEKSHGDEENFNIDSFRSYDLENECEVLDKTEYDLILVGKGVTFDSGGLSLKSPKSQLDMKGDMMGASVVFSTILTAAKEKLQINVKVLIPLVENLPSGCATKPSDVFIGRSNISVEINNTDAEGRLILADALACAEDFTTRCILSCATLTGAVIVSLGSVFYGIYSTDDQLFERIQKTGETVADSGWRMPFDKKYLKLLESDVADLSNVAYSAGSVTAAVFLKEFVKKYPYVHLDIAGMLETNDSWGKKFGCRPTAMLYEFCRSFSD